jgi:hypothetical protein
LRGVLITFEWFATYPDAALIGHTSNCELRRAYEFVGPDAALPECHLDLTWER